MNYCVIIFSVGEGSKEKRREKKPQPIKYKHGCVTNGSMFDLRVFVLGRYIKSVVCLHLTRPVLGSYIVISSPKKKKKLE